MEQILTEEEVRVMYQEKQREPFPVRKNVMGILLASLFIVGTIVAYLAFWALLMHVFGFDRMPDDVITTAIN
jgi:peptidoglycan biosynthesis protein MviN/MurJ (putative lipid II flippase)